MVTACRFAILICLEAHLDPVRLLGLDVGIVHLVRSPSYHFPVPSHVQARAVLRLVCVGFLVTTGQ